jgi:poly-gamma-glutamate capsule biosynthesis protein CapA/YwtB (metallophosphatase superfamily)
MGQDRSRQNPAARIMFGGDVMLGRTVAQQIVRHGAGYPLGPLEARMRGADLTVVNLECAITSATGLWPGAPKAFYFGAPAQAVDVLVRAGVDLVSLANNHSLDFGYPGLHETLRLLRGNGIAIAGAGADLAEALAPALLECAGIKLGMAAFCDHQPDFAAEADRPGIAYLDFDQEASLLTQWEASLESMEKSAVDWPILSLHWGPNMAFRPSPRFRRLAQAAVDMGWKIVFGHSAHVFQGIELYRGRPIIYAAGDLVDDYYVDLEFRNDHQLLLEVELEADRLRQIVLHPVFIEDCQARPAAGDQFEYICDWMSALCGELGTQVTREGMVIRIQGATA